MPYIHEIAGDRAAYIAAVTPEYPDFSEDSRAGLDLYMDPIAFDADEIGSSIATQMARTVGEETALFEYHPHQWRGVERVQIAVSGERIALSALRHRASGALFWDNQTTFTDRAGLRDALYHMIDARP